MVEQASKEAAEQAAKLMAQKQRQNQVNAWPQTTMSVGALMVARRRWSHWTAAAVRLCSRAVESALVRDSLSLTNCPPLCLAAHKSTLGGQTLAQTDRQTVSGSSSPLLAPERLLSLEDRLQRRAQLSWCEFVGQTYSPN